VAGQYPVAAQQEEPTDLGQSAECDPPEEAAEAEVVAHSQVAAVGPSGAVGASDLLWDCLSVLVYALRCK
jgi:hypothetical protein